MIHVLRTNAENPDFIKLVRSLDAELARRDGDEHAFYDQFNKIDAIKFVVVAYENSRPVGCGALKEYGTDAMEIKRMYVNPEDRRNGNAGRILAALEKWSAALGRAICILETGTRQEEAVRLYEKHGYRRITNYGQYAGVENSLCFMKEVGPHI
jgi:GNAT superfamily N-acetyltransferase